MSAHLPECIYEPEHWDIEQSILWGGKPCICDRLRACEQRSYALGIEVGKHDGWLAGHAAGVVAARDAVAALSFDPLSRDQGPAATQRQALAAIDALSANPDNRRVSENPDDAR